MEESVNLWNIQYSNFEVQTIGNVMEIQTTIVLKSEVQMSKSLKIAMLTYYEQTEFYSIPKMTKKFYGGFDPKLK